MALMASKQDLWEQKGRQEEEFQVAVIFYSKFHYELNFIERFWCAARGMHARIAFASLRQVLPKPLILFPVLN